MFIRAKNNRLVNLLQVNSIDMIFNGLERTEDSYAVMACFLYENNNTKVGNVRGETRLRIDLYLGTKENCQKYMTELEKELAAFGKLVRVEVE